LFVFISNLSILRIYDKESRESKYYFIRNLQQLHALGVRAEPSWWSVPDSALTKLTVFSVD